MTGGEALEEACGAPAGGGRGGGGVGEGGGGEVTEGLAPLMTSSATPTSWWWLAGRGPAERLY